MGTQNHKAAQNNILYVSAVASLPEVSHVASKSLTFAPRTRLTNQESVTADGSIMEACTNDLLITRLRLSTICTSECTNKQPFTVYSHLKQQLDTSTPAILSKQVCKTPAMIATRPCNLIFLPKHWLLVSWMKCPSPFS